MKEINIIEIIKIATPLAVGFLAGYCIQKLKNRPEITTHGCRVSGQQVYTYFCSNNKPSCPVCPHLLEDGKCNYPINADPVKKQMLSNKSGKCYLLFWKK